MFWQQAIVAAHANDSDAAVRMTFKTPSGGEVVTPDGFEPSTCRLGGGRSIP
jgi:hypothetical protein